MLVTGFTVFGQGQNDFSARQAQNQEIYIQFDKPFYLSGQNLWYSLFNTTASDHKLIFGRRFMEMALVDRNKQVIIKERIKVEDGRSTGQLLLPAYLTSGRYMLVVSYPFEDIENFLYRKVITIYNPSELINANPAESREVTAQAATVDGVDSDYATIVTNKRNYGPREKVSLTINTKGFGTADLSIVVREKGMALEPQRDIRSITLDANNPEVAATLTQTELLNYREKKPLKWSLLSSHGLLLYELLQEDSLVQNSIPYAYIPEDQTALSIFEVRPGQFVLDGTELSGGTKSLFFNNFVFNKRLINNMTHWTEKDMAENQGEMNFSFIVRPRDFGKVLNDDVNKAVTASAYVTDYAHRKRIREDIFAGNAYVPVEVTTGPVAENKMMYKSIFWRNADDYSEMATVPEFLKEVVMNMKVWDNPRRKDVRLNFSGGMYSSQPLFLVNGVPTLDLPKIFEMPMADVQGVGVIKDPQNRTQMDQVREVANFGYFGANGVIVIQLREGVDNPFRQEYDELLKAQLYVEPQEYPLPAYNRRNLSTATPDFRPVLYWQPNLKVRRSRASVDFYTSDDVGVYEIIVEGIGQNGEVIHARQTIMLGNPKLYSQE